MFIESEGMVLKGVKLGNNKEILTIFTKKYGKLAVNFFGNNSNKKNKSYLASKAFVIGNYEIKKNREYYNYIKGSVIKNFYSLSEDIDKYMESSYVIELVDKVLEDEEKNAYLFQILTNYLYALEDRKAGGDILLLAFFMKLFDNLGIFPRLDRCQIDNSPCEKDYYFSVIDGGLICKNCYNNKDLTSKNRDILIYKTNFDIIKIMIFLRDRSFEYLNKVVLQKSISEELLEISKKYLSYHLGIGNLKSEKILESLKGGNDGNYFRKD